MAYVDYDDYCAGCTYLKDSGWCERKGENHNGNDPRCYDFCRAYSRSESAKRNLYEYASGSSGCYLTTIMCNILKFDDNNYYLNTLRSFRDNVMQKDIKYFPLLMLYDMVGPMIAYELDHDKDKKIIAKSFFNNYIVKAVDAINEEQNETAINIYKAMTYSLGEKYHINIDLISPNASVDSSSLGHGYTRKLVKNN